MIEVIATAPWHHSTNNMGEGGLVSQVTKCRHTDDTTDVIFYVRENVTGIDSFLIAANERQGDKAGSTPAARRQCLELFAPACLWEKLKTVVQQNDPLKRPVRRTKVFNMKFVNEVFKTNRNKTMRTIKQALIVAFLTISTVSAMAQKKTEYLSKKNIGSLECQYELVTDLDAGTKSYYVAILYIDKRYEVLQRYESIFFNAKTGQETAKQLIKDLTTASTQMYLGSNIEWKRDKYKLQLYDFSDNLYLNNEESAYTTLSLDNVKELIKWLESLDLKKSNASVSPDLYKAGEEAGKKGLAFVDNLQNSQKKAVASNQ